jgi:formyltetrahydrofolate deformylase
MSAGAERVRRGVITLQCHDTPGVIAAVAGFLADRGFNIIEASQSADTDTQRFFMRAVFGSVAAHSIDLDAVRQGFREVADRFDIEWAVEDIDRHPRVLIGVSKFGHCLFDLVHRWRSHMLPVEVVGVFSNHPDMRSFVEWNELPFYHLPVTAETKREQEGEISRLVRELDIDLVVLARYMQILSPALCADLGGRCINIHHSFLPSFKGARPYHQAHQRGVKLIGATAHYVTNDLDEGPIIEQDVERVAHGQSADEYVRIGRDAECAVLAKAVRWHAERRIMLSGGRTIVFA